jgi:hypothetical protein
MHELTRLASALFVDRATQQWIVRDGEGNFWTVPSSEDAWARRCPYELLPDSDLAPVPGHYKYLLNIPL